MITSPCRLHLFSYHVAPNGAIDLHGDLCLSVFNNDANLLHNELLSCTHCSSSHGSSGFSAAHTAGVVFVFHVAQSPDLSHLPSIRSEIGAIVTTSAPLPISTFFVGHHSIFSVPLMRLVWSHWAIQVDDLCTLAAILAGDPPVWGYTHRQNTLRDNSHLSSLLLSRGGPFVLGISGPSQSGKSTLAARLQRRLALAPAWHSQHDAAEGAPSRRVAIVGMDDFFDHQHIEENLQGNYDLPDSIDHEAFRKAVASCVEQFQYTDFVIVEGYMAFFDHLVCRSMHLRVFIDAPFETCAIRRETGPFPLDYIAIVVPNAVRYTRHLAAFTDISSSCAPPAALNGLCPPEELERTTVSLLLAAGAPIHPGAAE